MARTPKPIRHARARFWRALGVDLEYLVPFRDLITQGKPEKADWLTAVRERSAAMQTAESKAGVRALFNATPTELGQASLCALLTAGKKQADAPK